MIVRDYKISDKAKVIICASNYVVINSIIVNSIKDMYRYKETLADSGLVDDFAEVSSDADSGLSMLEFNDFVVMGNTPTNTKWICIEQYQYLTKRQKDVLMKYLGKPFDTGMLVIEVTDMKDSRQLMSSPLIKNSEEVYLANLFYPSRKVLKQLVIDMFEKEGMTIGEEAAEIFIIRTGNDCDNYPEIINKLRDVGTKEITPRIIVQNVKDTNYSIDRLLLNIRDYKGNRKGKAHKVLDALLIDMEPREILNKLLYRVNDMVEFRLAVNMGIIPAGLVYSIEEAKESLGDRRIRKYNHYKFRRYARYSCGTSLGDWVDIKNILESGRGNNEQAKRAILTAIHRKSMSDIAIGYTLKMGANEKEVSILDI